MARLRVLGLLSLCMMGLAGPSHAQDGDRLWGRVLTASGEAHEGFIRWGRTHASWVDVLDGTKTLPPENYTAWLAANDSERAVRVVELRGHRVTWEEEHPDFPLTATSRIRFGHIASMEIIEDDRVELRLRSGQIVALEGGSDLGNRVGPVTVEVPGEAVMRLRWRDLERIDFSSAPGGARATSRRLHGTVRDGLGRRFTGYIAWDLDEILESDELDGDDMDGDREYAIPFGDIVTIEPIRRGSRVELRDGRVLRLTRSNDVDDDNRGIRISDYALGLVEIEWDLFRSIRFHEPDAPVTYAAFDGGRPLKGTVITQGGEELSGAIRWDADEATSWEVLDGRQEGAVFKIELGWVSRVERREPFGARVTLTDGRSFELENTNDVDWDNKGIMVAPENADHSDPDVWRVVAWDDFLELQLR